jgi:hypothetical protein
MVLSRLRIVIARSLKGDEAIHDFATDMDCFAEPVIGPATSGRTRWLAMTIHDLTKIITL